MRRWIHGVVGIWTIVSAFLGMPHDIMVMNLMLIGIVVLLLGFPEKSNRDETEYKKEHGY